MMEDNEMAEAHRRWRAAQVVLRSEVPADLLRQLGLDEHRESYRIGELEDAARAMGDANLRDEIISQDMPRLQKRAVQRALGSAPEHEQLAVFHGGPLDRRVYPMKTAWTVFHVYEIDGLLALTSSEEPDRRAIGRYVRTDRDTVEGRVWIFDAGL